ncbi:MAG: L,D-transpeptidase, partial [Anaerolineaceae bacterium]|nr:L,D-transpeptidase [Anaerolineaceae bacterium]
RTTRKRPCRHMFAEASDFGSGFDLPGVPWVSYITGNGVAFHGAYWHNDYGTPRSHGCINMAPDAARWIYLWTMPSVPVDKHYYEEPDGTLVRVF